jgi:hypothetical protein
MKAMLDFYQNSYRMMAPTVNPFGFMSDQTSEYRGSAEKGGRTAGDRPAKDTRTRSGAVTDAEEVIEMKRRLAELEEVVSDMAKRPLPRKKRARKPIS